MFLFNSCQKRDKELSKDFDLVPEQSIINTIKNNLLLSSAKSEKISLKKKQKHQQVLFASKVSNFIKYPMTPSARIVHPSQPNCNFFRKSAHVQTQKMIRHRSPQNLPCVRFSYSDRKNEHVTLKKIVEEKPGKEECLFSFMQMEKDRNLLSAKNEEERGNSMLMKTNTTICESQYIADSLSDDEIEEEKEIEEIKIFSNFNMKRTESIKVTEEEENSILENFDKESFIIRFSEPLVRKKEAGSTIN